MLKPLVSLVFLSSVYLMRAESSSEMIQRLQAAEAQSRLNDPALKPWHLTVAYEVLDAKGAVKEKGTLEEWWAAPEKYRISYRSPSYTASTTRDGERTYRTKNMGAAPELERLLNGQMVHPMPSAEVFAAATLTADKHTFGKIEFQCFMLGLQQARGQRAPLGLYPTYCLDLQRAELRLSYDYGSQAIVRDSIGTFQGRSVATAVRIIEGQSVVLRGNVEHLLTFLPNQDEFIPTLDQELMLGPAVIDSEVVRGLLLTKVTPNYPLSARQAHISGAVVLRALIGLDGHVESLRAQSSPDASLTQAAIVAVRQWMYRPYLVNGAATEVETTITVHFNMGG